MIADEQLSRFDAQLWLSALTTIGGGYALMSGRKLAFLVDGCDTDALAGVVGQIIGQPGRQEAIKASIERRQCGEGVGWELFLTRPRTPTSVVLVGVVSGGARGAAVVDWRAGARCSPPSRRCPAPS